MRFEQTESTRASLRAFMQARGLKVTPWCERARIRESTLRSFLSGRSQTLTLATLQALARAESVGVAELIGESAGDDARERELLRLFRAMPRAQQDHLLSGGPPAIDPATVNRVARWVLTADRQFDQQRSPEELAETIGKFAATEPSGDLDFWESKLREQIERAVRCAPHKPSVDD